MTLNSSIPSNVSSKFQISLKGEKFILYYRGIVKIRSNVQVTVKCNKKYLNGFKTHNNWFVQQRKF